MSIKSHIINCCKKYNTKVNSLSCYRKADNLFTKVYIPQIDKRQRDTIMF